MRDARTGPSIERMYGPIPTRIPRLPAQGGDVLRLVMSPAVQMGIPLEAFGLRTLRAEVRNVRWRTAILDLVCLTVLEIFQLSVEDRV